MTGCSKKHCIIGVIAVFAFSMLYDFLVHGHLLKGMYEATASLWRTEEEMQQMAVWCFVYHALLAITITCIYKRARQGMALIAEQSGQKKCPYMSSVCFGLKIGTLMGLMHASSYIWLPIPGSLAIAWFIASLGQAVGMALVLALVYRNKDCKTA
jgi:hypothetical protein